MTNAVRMSMAKTSASRVERNTQDAGQVAEDLGMSVGAVYIALSRVTHILLTFKIIERVV